MSQPLEVDPSELAHSGGQLGQIGLELKTNAAAFLTGMRGLGNFGGTDAYGDLFHGVFDPARDGINQTGSDMGDYVSGSGDHLLDTANSYTAVNQFNDESIRPVSDVTHLP